MRTALIALSALALATGAQASANTNEVLVHYDDLNLSSPKGQKILERRLERAAQEVCEINSVQTGTRIRSADSIECLKQARAASSTRMAAIIDARVGKGG